MFFQLVLKKVIRIELSSWYTYIDILQFDILSRLSGKSNESNAHKITNVHPNEIRIEKHHHIIQVRLFSYLCIHLYLFSLSWYDSHQWLVLNRFLPSFSYYELIFAHWSYRFSQYCWEVNYFFLFYWLIAGKQTVYCRAVCTHPLRTT